MLGASCPAFSLNVLERLPSSGENIVHFYSHCVASQLGPPPVKTRSYEVSPSNAQQVPAATKTFQHHRAPLIQNILQPSFSLGSSQSLLARSKYLAINITGLHLAHDPASLPDYQALPVLWNSCSEGSGRTSTLLLEVDAVLEVPEDKPPGHSTLKTNSQ
ncbi:hypothetical protein FOPE_09108 [Fonsecaea pedrosoi]|nr:hypothetical protein FOPE_09108 [Fonsecaea pedrosoi]